jgi:S1-C subfamily serine protease
MRASGLCAVALVVLEGSSARPARGRVAPPASEPTSARRLSRAFATVAQAVRPSVVRLEVSGDREDSTASGVIIDTRGNVVTSSHLFDGWTPPPGGEAEAIAVVLIDGRTLPAELVGVDASSDVAVVRMRQPPRDLTAARFGDSDEATVGEWVLAVGSPLGLDQTVTAGIISSRPERGDNARPRYLLTDANVNPGDSGGPLVDLDGEVVGLTSAISAGPGGSYGYAVPINRVRRVAVSLMKEGHALHPYIGVGLRDLRDLDDGERRSLPAVPSSGALVSRVWHDAPAGRAGLRRGDVITSVNDQEVPTPADLVELIAEQEVGGRVLIGFVRAGANRTVPVSIADLPVVGRARGAPRDVRPGRPHRRSRPTQIDHPSAESFRPLSSRISVISAGAPNRIGGPQ